VAVTGVRYLLHSDFMRRRLTLSPADAVGYLRERVQARLAAVSAEFAGAQGPHGPGSETGRR
jgi:hypothetical protein